MHKSGRGGGACHRLPAVAAPLPAEPALWSQSVRLFRGWRTRSTLSVALPESAFAADRVGVAVCDHCSTAPARLGYGYGTHARRVGECGGAAEQPLLTPGRGTAHDICALANCKGRLPASGRMVAGGRSAGLSCGILCIAPKRMSEQIANSFQSCGSTGTRMPHTVSMPSISGSTCFIQPRPYCRTTRRISAHMQ